jgi:hypothetical protein
VKEILKAVRGAIRDLEAGKAVPALRRLEKLEKAMAG